MYVRTYLRTYVCTYLLTYVCMNGTYVCMYVCMYVCITQMRGVDYDHIVIETTGIAEPKSIRANFHAAEDYGMNVGR